MSSDKNIIGLADGYDSQHQGRKVMRGVRGLINELYLDDLRHKTQRGMHGQVDRGYIAGGKSYGYDIVKDEAGSRYVINEEQAHWVRWIFQKVANGHPFCNGNTKSPTGRTCGLVVFVPANGCVLPMMCMWHAFAKPTMLWGTRWGYRRVCEHPC